MPRIGPHPVDALPQITTVDLRVRLVPLEADERQSADIGRLGTAIRALDGQAQIQCLARRRLVAEAGRGHTRRRRCG